MLCATMKKIEFSKSMYLSAFFNFVVTGVSIRKTGKLRLGMQRGVKKIRLAY